MLLVMRKNESTYRLSGLFGHNSRQEITENLTPRAVYMERMVRMMKKDQGERGMEKKNPLLPPNRKPYMVLVTVSDSVQCDKG